MRPSLVTLLGALAALIALSVQAQPVDCAAGGAPACLTGLGAGATAAAAIWPRSPPAS